MSTTKKQRQNVKKMSKAQMQLAIIKKKQCDAKALAIIEQLLEPNVDPTWLLQNLAFINKNHMEDVIEERAIIKLCGYVLCKKPLTVIIRQQYHISTLKNKVYDVSKRKNFCSSSCYGASNYLLEQMLESPLWLREKEDIPIFQIMPINLESTRCTPGDEIDVVGIDISLLTETNNVNDNAKTAEQSTIKQTKRDMSPTVSSSNNMKNILNDVNTEANMEVKNTFVNTNEQCLSTCKVQPSKSCIDKKNRDCMNYNNYNDANIHGTDVKLDTSKIQSAIQSEHTLHEYGNKDIENRNKNTNVNETYSSDDGDLFHFKLNKISSSQNDVSKTLQSQSVGINKNQNENKMLEHHLDKTCNSQDTKVLSDPSNEYRRKKDENKINRNKACKQKRSNNTEQQDNIYYNLAMCVEQSVREWITENTICLLLGEADTKCHLLESLTQHDKYLQLCKKLNRLQLQDEKEDHANLAKNTLKPLPEISVLQEEGKKLELKVRAFYEGQMKITLSENDTESENKNDPILPLTDAHTPNALRRRIFLDKLNKILPDLLRILTTNANTSQVVQYTYNNERYSLIKILVGTFNLSATNIVFKTAEWTLVGLIVIKMLSLIDDQLQSLFMSKQASMFTSMILTTYKLDCGYLDRLILEITNNMIVSKPNDKNKSQN